MLGIHSIRHEHKQRIQAGYMRITGILDPTEALQASSLSSRKRSLSALAVQLHSLHSSSLWLGANMQILAPACTAKMHM